LDSTSQPQKGDGVAFIADWEEHDPNAVERELRKERKRLS
jgi:hypothetical protein